MVKTIKRAKKVEFGEYIDMEYVEAMVFDFVEDIMYNDDGTPGPSAFNDKHKAMKLLLDYAKLVDKRMEKRPDPIKQSDAAQETIAKLSKMFNFKGLAARIEKATVKHRNPHPESSHELMEVWDEYNAAKDVESDEEG